MHSTKQEAYSVLLNEIKRGRVICYLLDKLHPTADGFDVLHSWFLQLASFVYTAPLAYLKNASLLASVVLDRSNSAVIRPRSRVAKVGHQVARAKILGRLMNAAPAWWGFCWNC